VRITLFAPDTVRVLLAHTGTFLPEPPWIIQNYDCPPVAYQFNDQGAFYRIQTARLFVDVYKSPFRVKFSDSQGRVLNEEHPTYRMAWDGTRVRSDKIMQPDDKFYGFGARFGDGANKRGRNISMNIADAYNTEDDNFTYVVAPFFMSPVGYGIFFHNPGRTDTNNPTFRLGTDAADRYSFESPTGSLDYFFFYGPGFDRIVEQYTALTERPTLSPL